MSDAVLTVTFAGPHVSVQDGGRSGVMRYGMPGSGPMDRRAFAAANLALGNLADTPGIEISLGGLKLECPSGMVSFALAGGGFIVDHAGAWRGSWSIATLQAADKLAIRPGPWGYQDADPDHQLQRLRVGRRAAGAAGRGAVRL